MRNGQDGFILQRMLAEGKMLLTMPSKYRNKPKRGYDSKKEADRALELVSRLRAGEISDLKEQVPFEIIPKQKGERPTFYIADFTYIEDGQLVVEDCKGMRTEVYRIKRKLMLLVHGIRILET